MNFEEIEYDEENIEEVEQLEEEEILSTINYLNKKFVELSNIDFSNITIQNLSQEFEDLKNKIIEKKNDGEYRNREVRQLFNNLSGMCDIRGHVYNITKLTSINIADEEFDNRDITLEREIEHLVVRFSQMIFLQDIESLDDFPLQLLELYKKLYFLYFKSFGIEDSLDNLFDVYYNLFCEGPKINLPKDIDPNSSQTFLYQLKEGEYFDESLNGNSAYFNFKYDKLEKKFIKEGFEFEVWLKEKLENLYISIPIDEGKYPEIANALRTKSPSDLPVNWEKWYYEDLEKKGYLNIPIFDANLYFIIPEKRNLWRQWEKQFFDAYQNRLDSFNEFINSLNDNDDSEFEDDSEFDDENDYEGVEDNKGFVYLIRNQDIFKIGITENLLNRMSQLDPDEIIDVIKCSNFRELEKDLHREYKDCRIPQTEYFRLDQNQIIEVSKKFKLWAK